MSLDEANKKKVQNFVIDNGIVKNTETLSVTLDDNNYGEVLLERMAANPTFVGQIDGLTGKKETFAEMSEKSVRCAMWLTKQNIQPGDVVAICTHNQLDMYVPCLASLYVGAIFNAWWDIGLTRDITRHFVGLTKPKFLFANETSAVIAREVIEEMDVETKIVVIGSLPDFQSLTNILSAQDINLVPEFRCTKLSSPDDPAVVILTSGSSGVPKGAVFSHRSLYANTKKLAEHEELRDLATSMVFSPLSWITGLYCMFAGFLAPHTRIIPPEFTEQICIHLIEKYKIQWMIMGMSTVFRLQKSSLINHADVSSLKCVFLIGAVVKESVQKVVNEAFPHTFICQAYGFTENGGVATEQPRNCKPGSCGTTVSNVSMKIVDPVTGRILGPNQKGEACFKFPYMMSGYYNNPEETSKAIDPEGWLHSGDLLYYDEDGYVFYADRLKELIKFRGSQVSPTIIEQLLQGHPSVKEVAVLSVPHVIDEEHPIAFVSKVPNTKVTAEDLQQLVSESLPDYMKLRGGVRFYPDLPHTASGKVDRCVLRKFAQTSAR